MRLALDYTDNPSAFDSPSVSVEGPILRLRRSGILRWAVLTVMVEGSDLVDKALPEGQSGPSWDVSMYGPRGRVRHVMSGAIRGTGSVTIPILLPSDEVGRYELRLSGGSEPVTYAWDVTDD